MNLLDPDCGMDPEERREILLHTDLGRLVIAAEDAAFFAVLFAEGLPSGWSVGAYVKGPKKGSPCLIKGVRGQPGGVQVKPIPEGYEPDQQGGLRRKESTQPQPDARSSDSDTVNQGHWAYAAALREAVANSYSQNKDKSNAAGKEANEHEFNSRDPHASDSSRRDLLAKAHVARRQAEAYALENKLRDRVTDAHRDAEKTNGRSLASASQEMHDKYQEHREKGDSAGGNPDLRLAHQATAMAHARQRDILGNAIRDHQEQNRSQNPAQSSAGRQFTPTTNSSKVKRGLLQQIMENL